MLRKTLTILSLIGLLLSVAAWGVSYWNIAHFGSSGKYLAMLEYWGLKFVYTWDVYEREGIGVFGGFKYLVTRWIPTVATYPTHVRIFIPFWIPALIFTLALSATRLIHNRRRRKRKKLGLCVKCGYDLRGSKRRCPECGTGFSN